MCDVWCVGDHISHLGLSGCSSVLEPVGASEWPVWCVVGDCVVINVKCKHKPPVTVIVSQLNDLH